MDMLLEGLCSLKNLAVLMLESFEDSSLLAYQLIPIVCALSTVSPEGLSDKTQAPSGMSPALMMPIALFASSHAFSRSSTRFDASNNAYWDASSLSSNALMFSATCLWWFWAALSFPRTLLRSPPPEFGCSHLASLFVSSGGMGLPRSLRAWMAARMAQDHPGYWVPPHRYLEI